jgi:hypothetical protein
VASETWQEVLARVNGVAGSSERQASSGNPVLDDFKKRWGSRPSGGTGLLADQLLGAGSAVSPEYARAVNTYNNAADKAGALDVAIDGGLGFLQSAMKVLDTGRAGVFGAFKELSDAVGGGGEASWDDWWEQTFEKREGFGDTDVFRQSDDDPLWLKVNKYVGAFAGDFVTDPLNWFTAGLGGAAKGAVKSASSKVLSEAAEQAVRQGGEEAGQALLRNVSKLGLTEADELVEQAAKTGASELAERAGREAAEQIEVLPSRAPITPQAPLDVNASGLPGGQPRLPIVEDLGPLFDERIVDPVQRLAQADAGAVKLVTDADRAFTDGAQAALSSGGARGLRQFYIDSLGEELGSQAFAKLPASMRGGLSIVGPLGSPFKDEYGLSKPLLQIDASSRAADLLDTIGVTRVLGAPRRFAAERKPVKWLGEHLGGVFGAEKVAARSAARTAAKLSDPLERASALSRSFRDLNGLQDAYRATLTRRATMDHRSAQVAGEIAVAFRTEGVDEPVARSMMAKYLDDPELLGKGPVNAADPNEKAAHEAAGILAGFYRDFGREMEAVGMVTGDQLAFMAGHGYNPRILTDESYDDLMRVAKEGPTSTRVTDSAASKSRGLFGVQEYRLDEAGEVVGVVRYQTNDEIADKNLLVKFITDPMQAWSRYLRRNNKALSAFFLADELKKRGLLLNSEKLFALEAKLNRVPLSAQARQVLSQTQKAVGLREQGVDQFDTLANSYKAQVEALDEQIAKLQGVVGKSATTGDEVVDLGDLFDDAEIEDLGPLFDEADELREALTDARLAPLLEARVRASQMEAALRQQSRVLQSEVEALTRTQEGLMSLINPNNLPEAPAELDEYMAQLIDAVGTNGGSVGSKGRMTERLRTMEQLIADPALDAEQREALRVLKASFDAEEALPSRNDIAFNSRELGDPRATELGVGLRDAGYDQVGRRAGRTQAVPAKAFEDLWGSEAVRNFVGRVYAVKHGDVGEFEKFLDTVYEPAMSMFRQMATVGRGPGFSLRNGYGGLWQNWAYGVSARDQLAGIKYAWLRHQAEKEARRIIGGDLGRDARRFALRRRDEIIDNYMRENGSQIVVRGQSLYDFHKMMEAEEIFDYTQTFNVLSRDGGALDASEIADSLGGSGRRSLFPEDANMNVARRAMDASVNSRVPSAWINWNSRGNTSVEQSLRAAAFFHGYREAGSSQGGRALATMLHFDYSDLSDFERRVMRNVLPFYTWMRHNIPLQAWFLLHRPGRVAALLRARESLEDASGKDGADGILPEWMKGNMFFETALGLGGGQLAVGVESPLMDLNRTFSAPDSLNPLSGFGMIKLDPLKQSLNPFVRVPFETLSGRSMVTGQPFERMVETPWWMGGGALNDALGALPGVETGVTDDGQAGVNQATLNALRSMVPFFGQADRLAPSTEEGVDKLPTVLASNFLGLPVTTVTEKQRIGALHDRSEQLSKAAEEALLEAGVDPDWWTWMRQRGFSTAQLGGMVNAGQAQGRKAPAETGRIKRPLPSADQ